MERILYPYFHFFIYLYKAKDYQLYIPEEKKMNIVSDRILKTRDLVV